MRVALVLLVVLSMSLPAVAAAPIEGDPDETLREVVASLDASFVEKLSLDRYALFALDALQAMDRCLGRRGEGNRLVLTCGSDSVSAPWPPHKPVDVARLLSNAARLVDPERVVRPSRVVAMSRALALATDDPFTAYLSPQAMAKAASQNRGLANAMPGIDLWPRDPQKVREVRIGTAAHKAGVRPGDRILSIDGSDVADMTFPEVLQAMSGMNGTVARLQVKKPSGETKQVMALRSLVPEDDIRWARLEGGATLYVHVPVFKSGVASEVRQVLGAGAYTGVILDLRHNPGGLLPEGIALLDTFLRDGPMAGVRSGPGRPVDDFVAHRDSFDTTVPLVVLIDGGSASASELCAKVLKETGRATVIGTTSAGKGSVQRQIPTPDGGLLKVTAGFYVGPTGTRLDEGGVRPHRFLASSPRRTALEGAAPADDSWVLSALDALHMQEERNALLRPSTGLQP